MKLDLLAGLEVAAKAVRTLMIFIGDAIDTTIPMRSKGRIPQTSLAAGATARGTDDGAVSTVPPAPAPSSPTFTDWATLAVEAVLMAHPYWTAHHTGIGSNGRCGCGERPDGLTEWRQHVAPKIANRIESHWLTQ